jgi:hypothetical protein
MTIAPVVGAGLGFTFAIVSLRRHGLALGTTLEEYRGAARVQSLADSYRLYSKIASGIATIVSIVELPSILLGQTAVLSICMAGWIVIIGYTIFRAWQIGDASLFGKFDVLQIVAAAALLTMFGAIKYVVFIRPQAGIPTQPVPALDLVKMILVGNALVLFQAIVIAIFGLNILYRVLDLTNLQRR